MKKLAMLRIFETKNKKRICSICNEFVEFNKIHIILEVLTVPPTLLFFHFQHYKCFLETLQHYFENKNNAKFEEFLKKPICAIEQEKKIAIEQGFETDFENDLSEIRDFLVYKCVKKTFKTEFMCIISKKNTNLEECFKCEMGNLLLCDKCILFSIKPKTKKFEIKKRI
ncbi:MAG: hypothetical protein ACFFCE_17815 [Promethearchaeota archaeon]